MRVVDGLEPVQVEEHQDHRLAPPTAGGQGGGRHGREGRAGQDPGERVDRRVPAQQRHHPAQRDGGQHHTPDGGGPRDPPQAGVGARETHRGRGGRQDQHRVQQPALERVGGVQHGVAERREDQHRAGQGPGLGEQPGVQQHRGRRHQPQPARRAACCGRRPAQHDEHHRGPRGRLGGGLHRERRDRQDGHDERGAGEQRGQDPTACLGTQQGPAPPAGRVHAPIVGGPPRPGPGPSGRRARFSPGADGLQTAPARRARGDRREHPHDGRGVVHPTREDRLHDLVERHPAPRPCRAPRRAAHDARRRARGSGRGPGRPRPARRSTPGSRGTPRAATTGPP